ncbi:MAG: hypothetical protein GWO41_18310 [candidate division Zixibacteria bacterium]|nr:hypothetical protein [candidate division Zixibacteria bacterium]NIR63667.1 hypothetical protein [candidate division Zixibacteria bacterium]NIS18318.1 hypothetical protein [candidate division Zixibacteria bacterium]NIS45620.1 hypothetical protein [candidate division Zixibacteria bacterium]NIT54645.1 hypothetical protein [candidate division Zixibacteria bacterium]
MNRVFKIVLILSLLLFTTTALGQERELVDKIAAVVGDEIILVSELDFQLQMFLMQVENPNLTTNQADSLRDIILQQMVTDKLLLEEAQKDTSIQIKEEQVEQALQQKIEELKARFPSEAEFEAQMRLEGLNIRELKAKFRREVRNQLIRDRYVSRFLSKVNVTSAEVQDFYEKYKDSLPTQPEAVKLSHILLNIEASGATLDTARMKAEKVKKLLDEGGDFTTLAQLYSEDKGTATSGGDLGYFERGTLFKEFEDQVFSLEPGEISEPFKTQLGYHIVKLEDKLPERVHARHILFLTQPSQTDEQRVEQLADSLHQVLTKGDAEFTEMVKIYSDDEETKKQGGELGWFATNKLTPEFETALIGLEVGDISEPTKSDYGYHILKILDRQDARPMSLEKDWDRLKEFAKREKSDAVLQEWLKEAKEKYYVDIRLDEN